MFIRPQTDLPSEEGSKPNGVSRAGETYFSHLAFISLGLMMIGPDLRSSACHQNISGTWNPDPVSDNYHNKSDVVVVFVVLLLFCRCYWRATRLYKPLFCRSVGRSVGPSVTKLFQRLFKVNIMSLNGRKEFLWSKWSFLMSFWKKNCLSVCLPNIFWKFPRTRLRFNDLVFSCFCCYCSRFLFPNVSDLTQEGISKQNGRSSGNQ